MLARRGEWEKLLERAKKSPVFNGAVVCNQNLALFHLGRMAGEMFTFPQPMGEKGLMSYEGPAPLAFAWLADLYFSLGLFNKAEHFGYESLTLGEESPWILRRLMLVHALKGEYPAALRCGLRLRRNPFFASWALCSRGELDSAVAADPALAGLRLIAPDSGYVNPRYHRLDYDLEKILSGGKRAPMALEYLMSWYMLSRSVPDLVSLLGRLPSLGYTKLPRHYEEAVLLCRMLKYDPVPDILGIAIDPSVYRYFMKFNGIYIQKFRGNAAAARRSLQESFGGTYWFYYLYAGKPPGSGGGG
jgi:hypothetical protein